MSRYITATGKIFTAGCLALALTPRAGIADFLGSRLSSDYLLSADRVNFLPTFGTLGQGIEYRYDFSDKLKGRLAYASMEYAQSGIRHSNSYDLNLKMQSRSVIFDWHPFGGAFRSSIGIVFGGANISGSAISVKTHEFGGQVVTGNDVIRLLNGIDPQSSVTVGEWSLSGADVRAYVAKIDPNQSLTLGSITISESDLGYATAVARYPENAPYFGFGWGNVRSKKRSLLYSIDIGVVYLGRPQVELTIIGPAADLAYQYFPAETHAYLAQEKEKIQASLDKYRYFPVFSIAVLYRF